MITHTISSKYISTWIEKWLVCLKNVFIKSIRQNALNEFVDHIPSPCLELYMEQSSIYGGADKLYTGKSSLQIIWRGSVEDLLIGQFLWLP